MPHHRLSRSVALGLALAALAAPAAGAQDRLQDPRSPDARDVAQGRGTSTSPQIVIIKTQPQSKPASPDTIDWMDAGIGGGAVLGVALIGLGGTLFVLHRRHAAHDAPSVAGV